MTSFLLFDIAVATTTINIEHYESLFDQPPPKEAIRSHSKILKGGITTGIDRSGLQPVGWGTTIFPYSIEQVWRGLNHEENHVVLSPVSKTTIIKGSACAENRQVFMQLPIPFLDDRWWITEQNTNIKLEKQSLGKMRELSWKKIPTVQSLEYKTQGIINPSGIEVEETRGSWILYEVNEEETIGIYHSYVDPGGYLPAGPINSLAAGSISDTIVAMQNYISHIPSNSCHMKKFTN